MWRVWTLDGIYGYNGISIDTNRDFLHYFIEYSITVLFEKWVLQPSQTGNISDQEYIFSMTGLNRCIGSSNTTHIPMLKYHQWDQNIHTFFKLSVPIAAYELTCDYSPRILDTTMDHPRIYNDKIII